MRSGKTQRTWTGMLLATALLGLVGVGYGGNGEARPAQRQCPPGQAACVDVKGARGPCHDLSGDRRNCGACGNVCGDKQKCVAGSCTSGEPACPAGQFACIDAKGTKGPCHELSSDRRNCGACGNVCGDKQKCVAGSCTSGEPACPAGQFACIDAKGTKGPCHELSSDRRNCGACGNVCGDKQKCVAGSCTSGEPACPAGQFACIDAKGTKGPCHELSSDRRNCGACGNVCGDKQKCVAGSCTSGEPACPAGQFACIDAKGTKGPCHELSSDRRNCGACGNVCGDKQKCVAGSCR